MLKSGKLYRFNCDHSRRLWPIVDGRIDNSQKVQDDKSWINIESWGVVMIIDYLEWEEQNLHHPERSVRAKYRKVVESWSRGYIVLVPSGQLAWMSGRTAVDVLRPCI